MGKTNIDMWYGDKPEQVTGLDIYFNDLGGVLFRKSSHFRENCW